MVLHLALGAGLLAAGLIQLPDAARAGRAVDLELVLAIDVSGSVDVDEFLLQREGYAAALRDPEVGAAIEALPGGMAMTALVWSGRTQQAVVLDWVHVRDAADARVAAARVGRMTRTLLGETALGDALGFALRRLDQSPFEGRRQTIDVSGDGKTNAGHEPDPLRDLAIVRGITINALAIVDEQPDLVGYYERHLIGGPGAFIMQVDGFSDFAAAIREKLLHEIRGGPLASGGAAGNRVAGR